MNIEFEKFEKIVMSKLLEGDDPVLEILRKQYENAKTIDKYFTFKGFFIEYSIPENLPRVDSPKNFEVGDLSGNINGTFVLFILFIRNGVIDFLEGCTAFEPWPQPIQSYDLVYTVKNRKDPRKQSVSKQRDMKTLRTQLEERKSNK